MSESENTDTVDQETKQLGLNPKKRVRHRKKQLYENVLKQMEFYFSDANLSKDRFLGDLVKTDPFVSLSGFLKFNKLKSMTQDIGVIVKALKHSTVLELSEDKLKVRRKIPMAPYDADLRTVYVESIPVSASREWLERVFSDYGHVAYISLPKFKNSQRIKGFAFIEFDSPQEAQKCVTAFTEMGCKLPTCMAPEELSSIKMFSVEQPEDCSEAKEELEPPKKKLKKGKDKKNQKTTEIKQVELDNEKIVDENKSTDVDSKDGTTSQDEDIDAENVPRKKKVKKRSMKDKKLSSLVKGEVPKGALWGLQVLSKIEWKSLRNKYLNLQRKYMKEMKANYIHTKRRPYSGIPATASDEMETDNKSKEIDSRKDVVPLQKIPGVFVKEILTEPCLDVRLTKRTIKSNNHVLHVDVKEGDSEVIVRFDSALAAEEYSGKSGNARVLCGGEEQEQWRRADLARRDRRGRTQAARPVPALTLAPASPQPTHTHIRFDDQ